MRIVFLVLYMSFFCSLQGQVEDTLIIKRVQNNEIFNLVKGDNIKVRTNRSTDSRGIGKYRIVEGKFMFVLGDSIWIDATSQIICHDASEIDDYYYLDGDGILGVETRSYRDFFTTNGVPVAVHREALGEIKYNKYIQTRKSMKFWSKMGLVSALIVSPLLAINYKTGDFNNKKYYWVSGSSLLFVGTTFSIYKLLSPKKFNFGTSDKRSYYLQ
jgi:hypothetical protein